LSSSTINRPKDARIGYGHTWSILTCVLLEGAWGKPARSADSDVLLGCATALQRRCRHVSFTILHTKTTTPALFREEIVITIFGSNSLHAEIERCIHRKIDWLWSTCLSSRLTLFLIHEARLPPSFWKLILDTCLVLERLSHCLYNIKFYGQKVFSTSSILATTSQTNFTTIHMWALWDIGGSDISKTWYLVAVAELTTSSWMKLHRIRLRFDIVKCSGNNISLPAVMSYCKYRAESSVYNMALPGLLKSASHNNHLYSINPTSKHS